MKYRYSLFGDESLGHRRFLYDGYLREKHPNQGVRFVLTAEKLKALNEKAERLAFQVEDTLQGIIHSNIWPVDRILIMSAIYCFLNARERVKCLFEKHPRGDLQFFTSYRFPEGNPPGSASSFILQLTPAMYEAVVALILHSRGAEIENLNSRKTSLKIKLPNIKHLAVLSKEIVYDLVARYRFVRRLTAFKRQSTGKTKPLLIMLNGFLNEEDEKICRRCANVLHLDGWCGTGTPCLKGRMEGFLKPSGNNNNRNQWIEALRATPLDNEDPAFLDVLLLMATFYPVSLLEERDYLRGKCRGFLKSINFRKRGGSRFAVSVDHRLWKNEAVSALADVIVENGGAAVGSSHDTATGLLNYGLTLTLDQCLISHYLGNFKNPFVRVQRKTPRVIQVNSLMRLTSRSKGKISPPNTLSIWYFPHYLIGDPKFQYWSYGMDNPESFFFVHETAMLALANITPLPSVAEIVVKLKYAPNRTREENRFIEFIQQFLGDRASKKVRFVSDLTMEQAIPHVSIAVHDIFSGGFVETVYAGIPSLAILSPEADVPYRIPERANWLRSGLFVRNSKELFKRLNKLIEGWMPPNYAHMRESFLQICGFDSPTPGEALNSIMTGLN